MRGDVTWRIGAPSCFPTVFLLYMICTCEIMHGFTRRWPLLVTCALGQETMKAICYNPKKQTRTSMSYVVHGVAPTPDIDTIRSIEESVGADFEERTENQLVEGPFP